MFPVVLEPRAREELRRLGPDEKILTAAMLIELRRQGPAAAMGGYHTRKRSYSWIACSASVAIFTTAPDDAMAVVAIFRREVPAPIGRSTETASSGPSAP